MTSTATEAAPSARSAGKRALICGVSGQDGAYLARHLMDRGYAVIGTSRDASVVRRSGLAAVGVEEQVNVVSIIVQMCRAVQDQH